ncbi:MAG: flagellar basal body L-ring protein FlgH [Desulfobacterium sp.]|jgi:flagellar L-ring protein precursor FlgH|nr:flagellar basal body L-ring protein FlgH [Desulfobacterium sp.]
MRQIVAALLMSVIALTGCMGKMADPFGSADVVPRGIAAQPVIEPQYATIPPEEGSLWTSDSRSRFFEDTKASMVGDTVIVDIVENTSSQMDVNTETSRKTGVNVGISNLFGVTRGFGATGTGKLVGADYANDFKGEAKNDRSGSITASIAARITEVLPNGNLSLFGRRAMRVNGEVQYISVSGVLRPGDIMADNRVKSTYLADSRIEYSGKGTLADKQNPGWGTRIMDNIWPF